MGEGTRQIDLYDFFSVLIPGATFVVGVLPLLPSDTGLSGTSGILILTLLGFVFGRGIHALGVQVEQYDTPMSHREFFYREIQNPSQIDETLVDRFYTRARTQFSLSELPADRDKLGSNSEPAMDSLYNHARSFIHIDARGRSRTFQAVLDFHRGMMLVSGLLCLIYLGYALTLYASTFWWFSQSSWAPYLSHIGSYGINPGYVFFGALFILAGAYTTFERVRSNYRIYYIQYLMTDFLILQETD